MNIARAEFKRRQRALMELMDEGSVAIVPSANTHIRNRDVEYVFRQDSDFYYLTGFTEPDALLVLVPGRDHGEVILFCQERDPKFETYNGERVGPERAAQVLGVDDGFPISDMDDILPGLLEGRQRIYMTLGEYPEVDRRVLGWTADIRARESGGAVPPGEFVALKHLLHELRLYKSPKELEIMRKAASITTAAHKRAMRRAAPGVTELQLEAELTYTFMDNGARSPAYPSIVAGGKNACVLHYIDNSATLRKGDLVLIDAGCEFDHYAADVSRTFPVTGRYSKAQRQLYDIVLEAQLAAIDVCRPGADFAAPHEAAVRVMVQGLIDLQIIDGELDEVLADESYRRFCPHKSSHWLGLDVHDVGDYRLDGAWRELEPGMVLTIEPGIYIRDDEDTEDVPARYRGIGIRIEDDVLITKTGHEVLTADVPKDPDEIEALMLADG